MQSYSNRISEAAACLFLQKNRLFLQLAAELQNILFGLHTEHSAVISCKLGNALIAYLQGCFGHIPVLVQHQSSGLRQPQPFLALQRPHSHRTFEFLMKQRYAHIPLFRQFFHGKRITKIFFYPAVYFINLSCLLDVDHALQKLSSAGTAQNTVLPDSP